MYHPHSAHTLSLRVSYDSQDKQRLYSCATLTDWCFWRKCMVFTVRYGLKMCNGWTISRRLTAKLSPRKPQFDPRPVYLRFVVDGLALRQGFFFFFLWFSLLSINPPILHIYLRLNLLLSVNGAKPGNLTESIALSDYRESLSRIVLSLSLPYLKDSVLQVCFYLRKSIIIFLWRNSPTRDLGGTTLSFLVELSGSRTLRHTHTHTHTHIHTHSRLLLNGRSARKRDRYLHNT